MIIHAYLRFCEAVYPFEVLVAGCVTEFCRLKVGRLHSSRSSCCSIAGRSSQYTPLSSTDTPTASRRSSPTLSLLFIQGTQSLYTYPPRLGCRHRPAEIPSNRPLTFSGAIRLGPTDDNTSCLPPYFSTKDCKLVWSTGIDTTLAQTQEGLLEHSHGSCSHHAQQRKTQRTDSMSLPRPHQSCCAVARRA